MRGAYDLGFSSGKMNAETLSVTSEYQYGLFKQIFLTVWGRRSVDCRICQMPSSASGVNGEKMEEAKSLPFFVITPCFPYKGPFHVSVWMRGSRDSGNEIHDQSTYWLIFPLSKTVLFSTLHSKKIAK